MQHSLISNKTTGVLSVAASICLCVIRFSFLCVLSHNFQDLIKTCRVCQCNFTKIFSNAFSKIKVNVVFAYPGKHFLE